MPVRLTAPHFIGLNGFYTERHTIGLIRAGSVTADPLEAPERIAVGAGWRFARAGAEISYRSVRVEGQGVVAILSDGPEPEVIQGRFSSPRVVAGGPITDDVMKCQLKPLDRDSYTAVIGGVDTGVAIPFTDEQWAQLESLYAAGVCDYSVPGVGQQGTVAWRDYSDRPAVQYSGTFTPPEEPEPPYPTCEPTGQYCFDDVPLFGSMAEALLAQIYDAIANGTGLPPIEPGSLEDQCEPFSGSDYCLSDIPGVGSLFGG